MENYSRCRRITTDFSVCGNGVHHLYGGIVSSGIADLTIYKCSSRNHRNNSDPAGAIADIPARAGSSSDKLDCHGASQSAAEAARPGAAASRSDISGSLAAGMDLDPLRHSGRLPDPGYPEEIDDRTMQYRRAHLGFDVVADKREILVGESFGPGRITGDENRDVIDEAETSLERAAGIKARRFL